MKIADIREYEKVTIVNLNNGERFDTYAIEGKAESGDICINGAAARLVQIGDLIIILTYALLNDSEMVAHQPKIVHVNAKNYPSP